MEVTNTLAERGKRYGEFADHAKISQGMKEVMRETSGWQRLSADQKEALEMIVHKIGRILNGDPNYGDSWHDIAGYSVLVEQNLTGEAPATAPFRPAQPATPAVAAQPPLAGPGPAPTAEPPKGIPTPPVSPVTPPVTPTLPTMPKPQT
jgi:hypothetical protein